MDGCCSSRGHAVLWGGDKPLCPERSQGQQRLVGWAGHWQRPARPEPHPCSLGISPACTHIARGPPAGSVSHLEPRDTTRGDMCRQATALFRSWSLQASGGMCANTHARTHACILTHTCTHSHAPPHACAHSHTHRSWRCPCPSRASFCTTCRRRQLAQSRVGTHLEVPVDDPHLVAVENRLQDLLDAVTVANSRRVSEGGLGGGVQEWEAVWHWGRGEAQNRDAACHTREATPARRGSPRGPAQGRALPATRAPPSPLTRPTEATFRGHSPVPRVPDPEPGVL